MNIQQSFVIDANLKYRLQNGLARLEVLIELEKELCATHSQRNAAMHLIRVVVEDLQSAMPSIRFDESGDEDPSIIPF